MTDPTDPLEQAGRELADAMAALRRCAEALAEARIADRDRRSSPPATAEPKPAAPPGESRIFV